MVLNQGMALEIIGWVGTLILVLSYLAKTRITLHVIAFISTVLKLYYCYQHEVWPLFANWVALFFLHIAKMYQLYKDERCLK